MPERTQRLDFRLTASNRKLIERAAMLLGQPITAFAIQALVGEAERVIEQDTQRRLSERDWKRFVSLLDDDQPAPALVRAARRYKAGRRGSRAGAANTMK